MKHSISSFCVLICFCLKAAAQQDSTLYQLMQIASDTERVNQLYKTGFGLRNSDPQLAYDLAQAAETEAMKAGSQKHLAKSYNLKGVLYYKKGDYTTALSYQNKALRLNEAAGYAFGSALNQTNIGNIYADMGYNDLAETAYLKALKAYNKMDNREMIMKSLMNLGVLKCNNKRYETAVRYFETALAMAGEEQHVALMASCNNNIGAALLELNQPDSALLYLEEGRKLLDLQDNGMEMADVYLNMAGAYTGKQDFKKAAAYLHLADSISLAYDYADARVHLYESYAKFFEKQQDYRSANAWLKRHYHLKDSISRLSREEQNFSPETDVTQRAQTVEPEAPAFKNGWILVILGTSLLGALLLLIRHKR